MLVLGEIHTGLLPNSRPLSPEEARVALALAVGEGVTQWSRPIPHTASPTLLHGVDCKLALGPRPGRRHTDAGGDNGSVRVVGTVNSRAVLTGGHLLQGSSWTVIEFLDRPRRLPWSHYLAHPGTLFPIGGPSTDRLAQGFLRAEASPDRRGLLDSGAIARHSMREVLKRPTLDRQPPIRTGTTRLRWAAVVDAAAERAVGFRLVDGERRRLSVVSGPVEASAVAAACEDLAVHDWLLTAVAARVSRARIGEDRRHTLQVLQPVVDHVTHLWAPGARTVKDLRFLWETLEDAPGLTHQWTTMTTRVREQVSFGAAEIAEKLLRRIETQPRPMHGPGSGRGGR
jgi:hypothetical protein